MTSLDTTEAIVVVQPWLAGYRLGLFDRLFERFRARNMKFTVVCAAGCPGDPAAATSMVEDDRPYIRQVSATYLPGGWRYLTLPADIPPRATVVIDDALRNLNTVGALLRRRARRQRVALWGHGIPVWQKGVRRALRMAMIRRADYYLAYTEGVRRRLLDSGLEADRVFAVQNAVGHPQPAPGASDLQSMRRELRLQENDRVVLFCGAMYPQKRLDLLVSASDLVTAHHPNVRFVFAGAGPEEKRLQRLAAGRSHVSVVSSISGSRKAALFGISHVLAAPGAAGLVVVDAFHYGVPPVICRGLRHGPEADYIEQNRNGVVSAPSAIGLAEDLMRVLRDEELHERLSTGCKRSAREINVDATAERFLRAILNTCH